MKSALNIRPLTLGCLFSALVLVLACHDNHSKDTPPPAPVQASPAEAALEHLFARDARFQGQGIQRLLRLVLLDAAHGEALWQTLRTGEDGLDVDRTLKLLAGPQTRPLLMAALDQDFRDRSAALKAARRAHPGDPAFHYDVAVVGGGPNGMVAALNIRLARPDLRVAVVEENPLPGDVFRSLGAFTWINSPEAPAFSTNEFTGLKLTAKDLLSPGTVKGGPYFLFARQICDLNDLTAFESGADLWLDTRVERIRRRQGQLELSTQDPALTLAADRVLVSTGLGRKPYFGLAPGTDPEPSAQDDAAPSEEHFEHLMARGARMLARARMNPGLPRTSFLAPYAGKRVAIIGSGDSANNMAELAAGLGPAEVYGQPPSAAPPQPGQLYGPGIGAPGGVAEVVWINQGAQDAEAFKAANKPRYGKTLPPVYHRFTRVPDRLRRVRKNPGGTLSLDLMDEHGHPTRTLDGVDAVWFGTGYQRSSSAALQDLARPGRGAEATAEEVTALIQSLPEVRGTFRVTAPGPNLGRDVETRIGRAFPAGDPREGVFLGGPVAAPLATRQELQDFSVTKNEASLNVNLPRVAALGAHLAHLPGYHQGQAPPLAGPGPATPLRPDAKGSLEQDVAVPEPKPYGPLLPLLAERPLGPEQPMGQPFEAMALRWLAGTDLAPFTAQRGFRIEVEAAGDHARLTIQGLEAGSAASVLDALARDPTFLRLALDSLAPAAASSPDHRLRLAILAREGRPALSPERIQVSGY